MCMDDRGASRHLGEQFKKRLRSVEVVQQTAAKYHVERAVLFEIPDIVIDEAEVWQVHTLFYEHAVCKIARANFEAHGFREAHAREADGEPPFQAAKIGN